AAGQSFICNLLPPTFGLLFFISYAAGTVVAVSLAYGSLPLLIGAAKNTLKTRHAGGGLLT
ncbi:hypothetical protein ACFLQK_01055, partial [bacterium]